MKSDGEEEEERRERQRKVPVGVPMPYDVLLKDVEVHIDPPLSGLRSYEILYTKMLPDQVYCNKKLQQH